jgi:hypothetical protein
MGEALDKILKLALYPLPLRVMLLRRVAKRFKLGSYPARLRWEAVERPWYGHCVNNAAMLARTLGIGRISVIEFGVAGGAGLLSLEDHALETERALGVKIDVYGFDTGVGLPRAIDYRDLPYVWPEGSFAMDREKLQAKLRRAQLIIGDVRDSVREFFTNKDRAVLGAAMFDLDLYSSTASALTILDAGAENTLPRVRCYFDDVIGYEETLYNDFTGARLAIAEFNRNHASDIEQLSRSHSFLGTYPQYWHDQVYVCHFFQHPDYSRALSSAPHQLSLR